jgi:hypothetical protein
MRKLAAFASLAAIAASAALAQAPGAFTAYLDSGAERNDVAGHGAATAELTRSQLKIAGSFEGLPAKATRATLREGKATGASGPEIATLEITPAAAGTFTGSVALTREQRDALLAGRLYVQLHAERGVAPDNAVLWGWLLAPR